MPREIRPLRTAVLVFLSLAAGAGGMFLLRPAPKAAAPPPAARKTLYQCPMHPQIIQDHPGDCPICGMTLVALEAGAGGAPNVEGRSAVTIDPERQQLIGLTTQPAVEGPLGGELRTSARIVPDETRIRHIHVKVEGYVEKLYVDFVGMAVTRGQPLLAFYSPDFVATQQDFLLALRTRQALAGGPRETSGQDLLEAARRRLALWDVPRAEVERLERTGEVRKSLVLRSPITGVVTAKTAVEGNRLTPSDTPFEITDLGQVWAEADVYEAELPRVKVGMGASLTLGALPGRAVEGRVSFIDPRVDPRSRTTRVRVELASAGGRIKPDMFGEMVLRTEARRGLRVPLDAVLDSGTRKVVFVALGDGRFEPREVRTGGAAGEDVEILSGLRAGENVVTRASFLVDSESRLRAALAQFAPAGAPRP